MLVREDYADSTSSILRALKLGRLTRLQNAVVRRIGESLNVSHMPRPVFAQRTADGSGSLDRTLRGRSFGKSCIERILGRLENFIIEAEKSYREISVR